MTYTKSLTQSRCSGSVTPPPLGGTCRSEALKLFLSPGNSPPNWVVPSSQDRLFLQDTSGCW